MKRLGVVLGLLASVVFHSACPRPAASQECEPGADCRTAASSSTGGSSHGTTAGTSGTSAAAMASSGGVSTASSAYSGAPSSSSAVTSSSAASAVSSSSPAPSSGPVPPAFFLHWSDIHIGSGAYAVPAFEYALGTVRPAFPGVTVLATGDLVEAGNNQEKWAVYRDMVDAAGLTTENYIETPGNHDSLLDGNLANYLAYTVAGRGGKGLYGVHHVGPPGQRIRIVTLNTASAGDPARDGAGYLKSAQVDEVLATLAADVEVPRATLVLGHHPPGPSGLAVLGTDDNLRRVLDATQAVAYLFGHIHVYLPSWAGRVLMTQATTEGNPGANMLTDKPGFTLFALDDGPVVKNVPYLPTATGVRVEFPVVMITRPANRFLGINAAIGDQNPWATPRPRASSGQVLRAGAFAPGGVESVEFSVDGAVFQPMVRVDGFFEALFSTPDADSCTVEVRATSGGVTTTDSITLALQ